MPRAWGYLLPANDTGRAAWRQESAILRKLPSIKETHQWLGYVSDPWVDSKLKFCNRISIRELLPELKEDDLLVVATYQVFAGFSDLRRARNTFRSHKAQLWVLDVADQALRFTEEAIQWDRTWRQKYKALEPQVIYGHKRTIIHSRWKTETVNLRPDKASRVHPSWFLELRMLGYTSREVALMARQQGIVHPKTSKPYSINAVRTLARYERRLRQRERAYDEYVKKREALTGETEEARRERLQRMAQMLLPPEQARASPWLRASLGATIEGAADSCPPSPSATHNSESLPWLWQTPRTSSPGTSESS